MRNNLKELRISLDLTQEEMANLMQCSRQFYNAIEKGYKNCSQKRWENLQIALKIPDEEMYLLIKKQ